MNFELALAIFLASFGFRFAYGPWFVLNPHRLNHFITKFLAWFSPNLQFFRQLLAPLNWFPFRWTSSCYLISSLPQIFRSVLGFWPAFLFVRFLLNLASSWDIGKCSFHDTTIYYNMGHLRKPKNVWIPWHLISSMGTKRHIHRILTQAFSHLAGRFKVVIWPVKVPSPIMGQYEWSLLSWCLKDMALSSGVSQILYLLLMILYGFAV